MLCHLLYYYTNNVYNYFGDFMNIEERINDEINKIRPFLQSDGGNIEFVKFEDGNVYVKLTGACSHCAMIDVTLKEGIEEILVNEIPEVKSVIKVD